jgi:hypothetical protein
MAIVRNPRYNHATQATQWERPPAVEALQRQDAEAQVGNFKELAKASMRLKREGDWINYTIANGRHFYYNDKTNEFQWERPVALLSQGIPGESAEEVGSSWTPYKDPNSGLIFWYDHVTGRSQWEPPEGCTDTQVPADTGEAEPEAVREVTDVDELFKSALAQWSIFGPYLRMNVDLKSCPAKLCQAFCSGIRSFSSVQVELPMAERLQDRDKLQKYVWGKEL